MLNTFQQAPHAATVNRIAQETLWNSVIDSVDRQWPELIEKKKQHSAALRTELRLQPEFTPPNYVLAPDAATPMS